MNNAQASAYTSPIILNNLQPGTHILQVRALDAVGNADASPVSFRWNVLPSSSSSSSSSPPPVGNNNGIVNNPSTSAYSKTQIMPAIPQSQQQQIFPPHITANAIPNSNGSSSSQNIQPTHNQNKTLTSSTRAASTGGSQFSGTSDYEQVNYAYSRDPVTNDQYRPRI